MGKQQKQSAKTKQKKEAAVFKVAGVRKPKTKTINTNLKKLSTHNKSKTEELNKKFDRLQESLTTTKVVDKTAKKISKGSTSKEPPPDMNQAAEEFAKL